MGFDKTNSIEEQIDENKLKKLQIRVYNLERQNYINKRQFLNEFDIDTIVEKIKNSNSKNIYNFKYCIDRIYNFSNLKDFYINDLEKMEQLIEKLKDIDKDSFGITKKEAIKYLIKTLKEKIKLLEQ